MGKELISDLFSTSTPDSWLNGSLKSVVCKEEAVEKKKKKPLLSDLCFVFNSNFNKCMPQSKQSHMSPLSDTCWLGHIG